MLQLDHVEVENLVGYQVCKYTRHDIALHCCRSCNGVAVHVTGSLGIEVISNRVVVSAKAKFIYDYYWRLAGNDL